MNHIVFGLTFLLSINLLATRNGPLVVCELRKPIVMKNSLVDEDSPNNKYHHGVDVEITQIISYSSGDRSQWALARITTTSGWFPFRTKSTSEPKLISIPVSQKGEVNNRNKRSYYQSLRNNKKECKRPKDGGERIKDLYARFLHSLGLDDSIYCPLRTPDTVVLLPDSLKSHNLVPPITLKGVYEKIGNGNFHKVKDSGKFKTKKGLYLVVDKNGKTGHVKESAFKYKSQTTGEYKCHRQREPDYRFRELRPKDLNPKKEGEA